MYHIEDATPLEKYKVIHGMVTRIPPGCVASYSQIADGRIAFGADTEFGQLQQSRLLSEGVIVNNMRIKMKQYQWQPEIL